jgi:hypothetical protein
MLVMVLFEGTMVVEFMLKGWHLHGTFPAQLLDTQESTSFKLQRLRREEKVLVKNEGCDHG